VSIIPSDQQSTVSAFSAGQGDLAQTWSPQNTALRQRGNQILCDARQTRLSMPAVWVAHPDFIKRKPEVVARWIRANLEAIDILKKDRNKAFALYRKYDAFRGFNYTDELLKEELEYVLGTYLSGAEQLKLFARDSSGKAPIVKSFEDISQFFIRQGRLKEVPKFESLVDDRYLKAAVAR
jgi:ABC-type nitrate/sulfonate/bicarbonate transport system substrate-binding protein